ncbi:MAG TPA: CRISPR-associated endonuclease Cas3'' [Armatimonadetes bacterium]|nr:CRISPR-associated endonuclease Cas3'' [Armatimonadota bacterium]
MSAKVEKVFVEDLTLGQTVTTVFVVRNLQLRDFRDRAGKYLDLFLADRTGEISGRVWEEAEAIAETLQRNQPVLVRGQVTEYQNRLQLNIEKIRPAREEEYNRFDFLPRTEKDVKALYNGLRATIDTLENPHLRQLLHAFFDDREFRLEFLRAPAAVTIHHPYLGGLVEHVANVLELAETLCRLYPELNRDLLLTGVLLHDIGKIREIATEFTITYTDEGRALNHLPIGFAWVREKINTLPDFPEDLRMLVGNIILGHHGRGEYGSPVLPMTVEAEALHYLENLDAQTSRWLRFIAEEKPKGERWGRLYDLNLKQRRYVFLATEEVLQAELPEPATEEGEGVTRFEEE